MMNRQDWREGSRVSRKVERDQGGLMSYGTCHTLPLVSLLSSWFFLTSFDALL